MSDYIKYPYDAKCAKCGKPLNTVSHFQACDTCKYAACCEPRQTGCPKCRKGRFKFGTCHNF